MGIATELRAKLLDRRGPIGVRRTKSENICPARQNGADVHSPIRLFAFIFLKGAQAHAILVFWRFRASLLHCCAEASDWCLLTRRRVRRASGFNAEIPTEKGGLCMKQIRFGVMVVAVCLLVVCQTVALAQ